MAMRRSLAFGVYPPRLPTAATAYCARLFSTTAIPAVVSSQHDEPYGTSSSSDDIAAKSKGRTVGNGGGLSRSRSSSSSSSSASAVVISAAAHEAAATFRKENNITLRDNNRNRDSKEEYLPMVDFDATPFADILKGVMKKEGFAAPTPTQAQSWPIALRRRDIISVAKTGSGKTCGFLLPAFQKLIDTVPVPKPKPYGGKRQPYAPLSGRGRKPTVLVLAPTRELTMQIEGEAQKFSKALGYSTTSVYGGTPKGAQIRQLGNGIDVLIATPGRCMDLAEMGALQLSSVAYLVLDEADRMLDMGFEPQIRAIVELLPAERQSIFFSATWPKEVQSLAGEFLTDPVQITIGDGDKLTANLAISQHIMVMKHHAKEQELVKLLVALKAKAQALVNASTSSNSLQDIATSNQSRAFGSETRSAPIPKMIIFVSRKSDCDQLVDLLMGEGYMADSLHGDKSQAMRERTMDRFRKGRIQIMVATDVASRGLDVKDIEVVVNYDFPVGASGLESYVHRIGRTARGTNSGVAYTFFTPSDGARARELAELLKRCQQPIPVELTKFTPEAPSRGGAGRRGFGRGGGGGGFRRGGGDRDRSSEGSSRSWSGEGSGSTRSWKSDSYSGGGSSGRSKSPSWSNGRDSGRSFGGEREWDQGQGQEGEYGSGRGRDRDSYGNGGDRRGSKPKNW